MLIDDAKLGVKMAVNQDVPATGFRTLEAWMKSAPHSVGLRILGLSGPAFEGLGYTSVHTVNTTVHIYTVYRGKASIVSALEAPNVHVHIQLICIYHVYISQCSNIREKCCILFLYPAQ